MKGGNVALPKLLWDFLFLSCCTRFLERCVWSTERGVEYVFSLRARNAVDHGEQAIQTINTPEGSESRNLIGHQ